MSAAKKKGLAAFKGGRKPEKANPREAEVELVDPLCSEDASSVVVPAAVGYGVNRIGSRVIFTLVRKRKKKWARHAAAATSIATTAAIWGLAPKSKTVAKRDAYVPLLVGSSIATIQLLVRLYWRKFGWLLADFEHDRFPRDEPKKKRQISAGADAVINVPSELVDDDDVANDETVAVDSSLADDEIDEGDDDDDGYEDDPDGYLKGVGGIFSE